MRDAHDEARASTPEGNPYASPMVGGSSRPPIEQRVVADGQVVELRCDDESFHRLRHEVARVAARHAAVDVPETARVIAICMRPATGAERGWREWLVDRGVLVLCALGAIVVVMAIVLAVTTIFQ